MSRRERLEAELTLAKLEEAFIERKLAGKVTNADRLALREARRAHRAESRSPAENGAQPETVGSVAEVEEAE